MEWHEHDSGVCRVALLKALPRMAKSACGPALAKLYNIVTSHPNWPRRQRRRRRRSVWSAFFRMMGAGAKGLTGPLTTRTAASAADAARRVYRLSRYQARAYLRRVYRGARRRTPKVIAATGVVGTAVAGGTTIYRTFKPDEPNCSVAKDLPEECCSGPGPHPPGCPEGPDYTCKPEHCPAILHCCNDEELDKLRINSDGTVTRIRRADTHGGRMRQWPGPQDASPSSRAAALLPLCDHLIRQTHYPRQLIETAVNHCRGRDHHGPGFVYTILGYMISDQRLRDDYTTRIRWLPGGTEPVPVFGGDVPPYYRAILYDLHHRRAGLDPRIPNRDRRSAREPNGLRFAGREHEGRGYPNIMPRCEVVAHRHSWPHPLREVATRRCIEQNGRVMIIMDFLADDATRIYGPGPWTPVHRPARRPFGPPPQDHIQELFRRANTRRHKRDTYQRRTRRGLVLNLWRHLRALNLTAPLYPRRHLHALNSTRPLTKRDASAAEQHLEDETTTEEPALSRVRRYLLLPFGLWLPFGHLIIRLITQATTQVVAAGAVTGVIEAGTAIHDHQRGKRSIESFPPPIFHVHELRQRQRHRRRSLLRDHHRRSPEPLLVPLLAVVGGLAHATAIGATAAAVVSHSGDKQPSGTPSSWDPLALPAAEAVSPHTATFLAMTHGVYVLAEPDPSLSTIPRIIWRISRGWRRIPPTSGGLPRPPLRQLSRVTSPAVTFGKTVAKGTYKRIIVPTVKTGSSAVATAGLVVALSLWWQERNQPNAYRDMQLAAHLGDACEEACFGYLGFCTFCGAVGKCCQQGFPSDRGCDGTEGHPDLAVCVPGQNHTILSDAYELMREDPSINPGTKAWIDGELIAKNHDNVSLALQVAASHLDRGRSQGSQRLSNDTLREAAEAVEAALGGDTARHKREDGNYLIFDKVLVAANINRSCAFNCPMPGQCHYCGPLGLCCQPGSTKYGCSGGTGTSQQAVCMEPTNTTAIDLLIGQELSRRRPKRDIQDGALEALAAAGSELAPRNHFRPTFLHHCTRIYPHGRWRTSHRYFCDFTFGHGRFTRSSPTDHDYIIDDDDTLDAISARLHIADLPSTYYARISRQVGLFIWQNDSQSAEAFLAASNDQLGALLPNNTASVWANRQADRLFFNLRTNGLLQIRCPGTQTVGLGPAEATLCDLKDIYIDNYLAEGLRNVSAFRLTFASRDDLHFQRQRRQVDPPAGRPTLGTTSCARVISGEPFPYPLYSIAWRTCMTNRGVVVRILLYLVAESNMLRDYQRRIRWLPPGNGRLPHDHVPAQYRAVLYDHHHNFYLNDDEDHLHDAFVTRDRYFLAQEHRRRKRAAKPMDRRYRPRINFPYPEPNVDGGFGPGINSQDQDYPTPGWAIAELPNYDYVNPFETRNGATNQVVGSTAVRVEPHRALPRCEIIMVERNYPHPLRELTNRRCVRNDGAVISSLFYVCRTANRRYSLRCYHQVPWISDGEEYRGPPDDAIQQQMLDVANNNNHRNKRHIPVSRIGNYSFSEWVVNSFLMETLTGMFISAPLRAARATGHALDRLLTVPAAAAAEINRHNPPWPQSTPAAHLPPAAAEFDPFIGPHLIHCTIGQAGVDVQYRTFSITFPLEDVNSATYTLLRRALFDCQQEFGGQDKVPKPRVWKADIPNLTAHQTQLLLHRDDCLDAARDLSTIKRLTSSSQANLAVIHGNRTRRDAQMIDEIQEDAILDLALEFNEEEWIKFLGDHVAKGGNGQYYFIIVLNDRTEAIPIGNLTRGMHNLLGHHLAKRDGSRATTLNVLWNFLYSVADRDKFQRAHRLISRLNTDSTVQKAAQHLHNFIGNAAEHFKRITPTGKSAAAMAAINRDMYHRLRRSLDEIMQLIAAAADGRLDPSKFGSLPWPEMDQAREDEARQGYEPLVTSPFDHVSTQTTIAAVQTDGQLQSLQAIMYVPYAHHRGLMTAYRVIETPLHVSTGHYITLTPHQERVILVGHYPADGAKELPWVALTATEFSQCRPAGKFYTCDSIRTLRPPIKDQPWPDTDADVCSYALYTQKATLAVTACSRRTVIEDTYSKSIGPFTWVVFSRMPVNLRVTCPRRKGHDPTERLTIHGVGILRLPDGCSASLGGGVMLADRINAATANKAYYAYPVLNLLRAAAQAHEMYQERMDDVYNSHNRATRDTTASIPSDGDLLFNAILNLANRANRASAHEAADQHWSTYTVVFLTGALTIVAATLCALALRQKTKLDAIDKHLDRLWAIDSLISSWARPPNTQDNSLLNHALEVIDNRLMYTETMIHGFTYSLTAHNIKYTAATKPTTTVLPVIPDYASAPSEDD